jgi:hypothetical protein
MMITMVQEATVGEVTCVITMQFDTIEEYCIHCDYHSQQDNELNAGGDPISDTQ